MARRIEHRIVTRLDPPMLTLEGEIEFLNRVAAEDGGKWTLRSVVTENDPMTGRPRLWRYYFTRGVK